MPSSDCVMLAAGGSKRTEKWKMTLPFGESTVVRRSVENALQGCGRVILVTGYRAGELEALFSGNERVITVRNPGWQRGMFSSIKTGAEAVETRRFFIALGDMPLVGPSVYETLLEYEHSDIVIPKFEGKKGHPVLLSSRVLKSIRREPDSSTLRDILALFPTLAVPVKDPGILEDIDTDRDYHKLKEDTRAD